MQKEVISVLSVEISFFLTVPKNFVGGINQCFRNFTAWIIFLHKKDISLVSVGIFFPQCRKIS